MTLNQPGIWRPPSVFITYASMESLGVMNAALAGAVPASGAWPSSNRTVYVPVSPAQNIVVKRMFCLNGATVGTDTITVALYSSDSSHLPSARLVTASATSAGSANACQFFDITDTELTGGQLYFMALAFSGTTATVFRITTSGLSNLNVLHFFTQNSNCPNPATPAVAATSFLPVFGLDLRGAP